MKRPRRSDMEVLRAILQAAKKLNREPYSLGELPPPEGKGTGYIKLV